ncbi:hypothetical protein BEL04_17435 [Mucilaginibacter sp. PPCGB 2223]|nr:hypothetical protein BEL04_17435 [Mucilaginibacter sp. PPCGB 2223]
MLIALNKLTITLIVYKGSLNIFMLPICKPMHTSKLCILLSACLLAIKLQAQTQPAPAPTGPSAPAELPGNGFAQHDFFYAGEGNKTMSIVKKGKVVWTYTDTSARGEISDAVLLSNGNVLFAHQFGITEITADKKLVWNYNAPAGNEIHTAQPIGNDKVLYIRNGNPAKLFVVDITTDKNLFEMELQTGKPLVTHPQFRHVGITAAGTLLVAHMDMGKVCEYDGKGNIIWQADMPGAWAATRLKNGNTLMSGASIREVNPKGETVWEFTAADAPDYKMKNMQRAVRLENGNTLINRWVAKGDGTGVQAIEVTPDKQVVWALRSWGPEIDLGRSTTIQILDNAKIIPEKEHFGNIR